MKHTHKPELYDSLKFMLVAMARKRGTWFTKSDVQEWVKFVNEATDHNYLVETAMRAIRSATKEEGEKGCKFYPLDRKFSMTKGNNGRKVKFAQYKARRISLKIIKK